jgi:hypothetical protein
MIAKVKSSVFIDALTVELVAAPQRQLRAVLRDDKGCECSRWEAHMPQGERTFTWKGLNDLPYGVYTLELSQGEEELKVRMVKRV